MSACLGSILCSNNSRPTPLLPSTSARAELVASGQTVYDFGKGDPEEPPPRLWVMR